MTLADNRQHDKILDFRDPRIAITRLGSSVQVAVQNREVNADLIRRLRHVLLDLVDGQGNLSLSVELPDVIALETDLLDVLLDTAEQLVARRGVLHVRTAVGDWSRPTVRPDDVA